MRSWTVVMLMALLGAGLNLAQDDAEADRSEPTREARTEASRQERREALRERIRRAMRLPRTTDEARQEGVPEEEVQEVLKTGRDRGVSAGDMQEILESENEELREGRKDNFGAAVQEMKASGLRGRDLADAIHAEQVARGMKKPKSANKGRGGHADEDEDREMQAEEAGEQDQDRADDESESKGKGKDKGKDKGKGKNKGR